MTRIPVSYTHLDVYKRQVCDWFEPVDDAGGVVRALSESRGAAVVNLCRFLPEAVIPEIDLAATAVLANSGHEPFGLVGLEAMAAGGVAVVGATEMCIRDRA